MSFRGEIIYKNTRMHVQFAGSETTDSQELGYCPYQEINFDSHSCHRRGQAGFFRATRCHHHGG